MPSSVIAEIGPYYDDGDVDALTPANRLGRFLIENYVPHGYGVAQVCVFGTGESNHCMDLMGTDEQRGIDAAVSWLGSQGWSTERLELLGNLTMVVLHGRLLHSEIRILLQSCRCLD